MQQLQRYLLSYFRQIEYQIESSATMINILLPMLIYWVSGGYIFGLQTYSVFTLIISAIYRFILLITTSIAFIKLQGYLHRYILNMDSKSSRKINSMLTNAVTLIMMSGLFSFVPYIRTLFSSWGLPLSILMYVLRTPMTPLTDILHLHIPDSFYDYYHVEIPLILSIGLACAFDTLWTSIFRPIVCLLFIISVIYPTSTEQIECSSLSGSTTNTVDMDRVLRPVIMTSHLTWLTSTSTIQTVSGFYLICCAVLASLSIWIRDRYVRIVDTSMSNRRTSIVQNIRTFHNSFYRFWQDTFEVTNYSQDRKIGVFLLVLKFIIFYPIHTLLSIISNIISGRKKYSGLYIQTLDLLILFWTSIPIQYADRYYLGMLYILYNLLDPWAHHLCQILNLNRSRQNSKLRFDGDTQGNSGQSVSSDSSLSEVPPAILLEAGISEDTASDLSDNVVLSEVTDESTVISTYQSRPVYRKRKNQW